MQFPSWLMSRLFVLAMALVAIPAQAQNDADPAKKPVLRELWLPQAQFEPLLQRYPKGVLLESKAYEQLLTEAIPELFPEGQPRERAVLVSAEVKATVSAETPEVLPVTAVIKARIVRDGWAEVALPSVMAYPGSVVIQGEAAWRFAGRKGEGEKGRGGDSEKQKTGSMGGGETLLLRGKAGEIVTVTMEGFAPITFGAEGRGVELRSPGAAISRLELTLPKGSKAKSNQPVTQKDNVALLSWRAGDAMARVTWSAGTENRLEPGGLRQEGAAAFVFEGDRALGSQELRLSSPLKPLPPEIIVPLPPETRPLRVEGADLLSWEVAGNALKITLQASERRETTLLIETDRPGASRGGTLPPADQGGKLPPLRAATPESAAVTLPLLQATGVQRVLGTVHLYAREGVRLQHIETGSGLIASPTALATAPAVEAALPTGQLVGAFFYFNRPGDLAVWARQVTGRFAADLDSRYQLGRHGVEGEHILRLHMLEGERFFHRVTLPDGETLSSVDIQLADPTANQPPAANAQPANHEGIKPAPAPLYEWRQEGNGVLLSWKNGLRPGGAEPEIHLHTRRDPADWARLDTQQVPVALTSPVVEDAEKIAGYVAVDGDQSLELETVSARGLESRDSRSTPVTGRLAWFRLKEFALGLNVRRKTAEFEARLTAYAVPLLQTTEIEGQIALDIRSSGLKTLAVGLPAAAAPHLRFEGAEVASRAWDEKTGLWTLTFREELTGQPKLRFRLSLPHLTAKAEAPAPGKPKPEPDPEHPQDAKATTETTETTARFSASLPVLTVPAARRVSGVWLIESNTDTEVSITAEGLDEADSLRPEAVEGYATRHRVIAAYTYLGNQYRLDLSGVRHQSADLPAVIVDDCRVLSVVTREGRAMHQLSLKLRGNGRQFFTVGLPAGEGLRLLSLVVDGAAAKPVAGPDGAVMIPLPQDAGQGRQVLAQLVYEGSAAKFLGSGTVRLQPPVFDAKTPVLAAGWDLVLPEGFTYRNWNSTFQTPEEEQPGKILPPLAGHFKPLEMLAAALGIRFEPIEFNRQVDFLPGVASSKNESTSDVARVQTESAPARPPPSPMAAPAAAEPASANQKPDAAEPLTVKTFRVPSDFIPANVLISNSGVDPFGGGNATSSNSNPPSRPDAKTYLISSGIQFPEGASATLNSLSGELKVINTETNIDLIEQVINEHYQSKQPVSTRKFKAGQKSFAERLAEAKSGKGQNRTSGSITSKLNVVIPDIQFSETSIDEAIEFLVTKSKELDTAETNPTRKGVNIIVRRDSTSANAAKITLNARNMPVGEALRYVTELAGMKYKVEPSAIVITPVTSLSEEFLTRVYRVPPDFIPPVIGSGGSNLSARPDARSYLISSGIQFPEGSSVTFNPISSQLIVRNTASNLDLIEQGLGEVEESPRHLKKGEALVRSDDADTLRKDKSTAAYHADRVGILPLLIELPESGVHVQLTGDHAPQALDFGYVTWERGARVAWLAILGGALLYGALAFRRRRWIFAFLVGAVLLTFVPPLFGAAAVRLGNGLLLGWLGMFLIKAASVMMRTRQAAVVPLAPAPASVAAPSL